MHKTFQTLAKQSKVIVIKVGSNILVNEKYKLRKKWLNSLVEDVAKLQKSGDEGEKRSAATRILQSRLSALQVQTGRPHSMVVEDLNDGTRVTLVLPLNHEWSEND